MYIVYYFVVASLYYRESEKIVGKNKNASENSDTPGRYDGKIDFINLYLGRNKN